MTDIMDFYTRSESLHIFSRIYQIWGGGEKTEAVRKKWIMKNGSSVIFMQGRKFY